MHSNCSDLCRLCGEKKKIVTSLFHGSIHQKIRDTVQLKISKNDALPKSACYECQRQIDLFYTFKVKCQRAEAKLYNIVTSGQFAGNKSVSIIKEEQIDGEPHSAVHLEIEHNYFAVGPKAIKTEVTEVVVAESVSDEETYAASNVVFEKLVYHHASVDVKKPIIEVICIKDTQSVFNGEDELPSKIESPTSVAVVDYVPEEKPLLIDDVISTEFSEEDFVLKDNEVYNIDYEKVEAEIMKKKDPNVRFKCRFCRRSFKFYKGYRKHKDTVHGEDDAESNSFFCTHCSKDGSPVECLSLASLKQHMYRMHMRDPPYTCSTCAISFRSHLRYRDHIKNHVVDFQCDFCRKVFTIKSRLRIHMRRHTSSKPFRCSVCGKSFKWSSSLQAHRTSHDSSKTMLCAQCGKKFVNKSGLMMHLKIHDQFKYSCSLCGKSFSQMTSLKRHENTLHSETTEMDGSYKLRQLHSTAGLDDNNGVIADNFITCPICKKAFGNHSNLANHKKIHEKMQGCQYCEAKFARVQQLDEHVMTAHLKLKHSCPIAGCTKSYTQRTPLASHFRKYHPGKKLRRRGAKLEGGTPTIQYECY